MATMTTTITLTPEQATRLQDHVKDGSFTSTDEVVQHFVSQVLDEELIAAAYSPEVMAELQQGMAEAERGEFVPQEVTKAFFEDWRRNG
jgi:Arc/MetJ-type ribon-helix-helix transcriptional regulator